MEMSLGCCMCALRACLPWFCLHGTPPTYKFNQPHYYVSFIIRRKGQAPLEIPPTLRICSWAIRSRSANIYEIGYSRYGHLWGRWWALGIKDCPKTKIGGVLSTSFVLVYLLNTEPILFQWKRRVVDDSVNLEDTFESLAINVNGIREDKLLPPRQNFPLFMWFFTWTSSIGLAAHIVLSGHYRFFQASHPP